MNEVLAPLFRGRDNTLHVLGRFCGSKIPSTWISGPRSRGQAAPRVRREACLSVAEERQNLRAQAGQSAWNACGFTVHAVWHGAANSCRRQVSQVRIRVAFLQAVHVLRSGEPV